MRHQAPTRAAAVDIQNGVDILPCLVQGRLFMGQQGLQLLPFLLTPMGGVCSALARICFSLSSPRMSTRSWPYFTPLFCYILSKVCDVDKLEAQTKFGTKTLRQFRKHGAIAYDNRILKWDTAQQRQSLESGRSLEHRLSLRDSSARPALLAKGRK